VPLQNCRVFAASCEALPRYKTGPFCGC
jgi:hypothetical protein